jgi:hypothetical protein
MRKKLVECKSDGPGGLSHSEHGNAREALKQSPGRRTKRLEFYKNYLNTPLMQVIKLILQMELSSWMHPFGNNSCHSADTSRSTSSGDLLGKSEV